ncbi:uncharacterized protein LOC135700179 [Ochlerotatus camptorhynchus]|uniref:uncharacterized protein LOC135700179 n=1 Tax=Ochlerotatus camptorhynchus TaxID=644619 RepID=UPI0031D4F16F
MANYGGDSVAAVKTLSSASTERWPSDEHYVHSSNGPLIATDASIIAGMLPIRDVQHLIELENRIVSVQQYECLLAHLQVLTIRYQGSLSEMLRNFITDPVLGQIGFIRTKNGTYNCAMKTDLQRIMMAIKASWFPDKSQECFEVQIAQLLKNSHARCKAKANDDKPQPGSPKSLDQPTVNSIKAEYQQTATYPQNSVVPPQNLYMFQQNQWYQYALYYRERYQIARKANQKMKADYVEQEKQYRKRISGCLKRVRTMQQYLNVLEERVQHLE